MAAVTETKDRVVAINLKSCILAAKHIIRLAKPKPEARFVVFHGYDDYATNLPLAYFDDDDVLIAHSWEGEPLTREHGGPARAIVPG